ncbi:hypothetical protein GCM10012280_27280 [Wenjunlia tyrosinilytica]|uniref:Uncharacterized protein n=2 Tax=Wenjunlia tyrosinilytica TaxID=1544741 RepID=A0A917ZR26_9ACTN|nr:hypothetical protein GCM10012280_27280 [Wenjunlia tyrosinilytica]
MCALLALTGCNSDESSGKDGASGAKAPSASSPAKGGGKDSGKGGASGGKASPTPAKGGASASTGTGTSGGSGGAKGTSPTVKPAASKAPEPGAGCDHKMPISPDEIAVYRYTPEGGSLSLIIKHGNWGCPYGDTDGAPFETVGKETYLPLDQAAYVTATNPIVESTKNQRIGVQELLDWLEAHPNSGLVFKYHLGDHGAIDSLEEVFTP